MLKRERERGKKRDEKENVRRTYRKKEGKRMP